MLILGRGGGTGPGPITRGWRKSGQESRMGPILMAVGKWEASLLYTHRPFGNFRPLYTCPPTWHHLLNSYSGYHFFFFFFLNILSSQLSNSFHRGWIWVRSVEYTRDKRDGSSRVHLIEERRWYARPTGREFKAEAA